MRLRLSPSVSFHARGGQGDDIYSFHNATGDVCAMSRDVAALCLAFAAGGDVEEIVATRPAHLLPEQSLEFARLLAERLVLIPFPAFHVAEESDGASVSVEADLLAERRPYVPRLAVYERRGKDAIVYGRRGVVTLFEGAAILDAADGSRTFFELVPTALRSAFIRLCHSDFAALKLLPARAEDPGIPSWAESTMPWPAIPLAILVAGSPARVLGLAAYHAAIGDAEAQFEETETTLSHLFRDPHPSLGGQRFGDRLAQALIKRGALAAGARIVEVGGGLGYVGQALCQRLAPRSYLVVDRSPSLAFAQRRLGLQSVVGDALRLPLGDGSADIFISNEMAGDLGSDEKSNHGALILVGECARVLAPGGLGYISEFGHPTRRPVRSDHLDHDEYSIRWSDLADRARSLGLNSDLVPVPRLIGLVPDAEALVTTRASFAALRSLFRAHGGDLQKRAWLVDELEAAARKLDLDLSCVHGIATSPIGDRTMGLVPHEFWALVLRKP